MRSIRFHHPVGRAFAYLTCLFATRHVSCGLEALEARRPITEVDRINRRSRIWSRTVPLLMQLTQSAVELHAFDNILNLVAVFGIFQSTCVSEVPKPRHDLR